MGDKNESAPPHGECEGAGRFSPKAVFADYWPLLTV